MTDRGAVQLRVPLAHVAAQFEADSRSYRGLNPATYLLFALCYDALAAPGVRADPSQILPNAVSPVYSAMRPRLAEQFVEEPDGSWTVSIRPGVRSHAGHELGAEDVKWAFEKVFALGTTGAYRWGQMAGMEGPDSLEVLDGHRLRFRLRAPNPHLPAFLSCGVPQIVDADEVRAHADDRDPWGSRWFAEGAVAGHGPYELTALDSSAMQFARREGYWSGEQLPDSIRVERCASRAEALQSFDDGLPTYLLGLRADDAAALSTRDDVSLVASWGAHTYLGMNYNRPPFDDVRVRRALTMAMPYREIIEQGFLGYAREWKSPLATFDEWYSASYWSYEPDVEQARELLTEAGFADGLSLTLHVPQRPDLVRVGELVQKAYAGAGVEVELRDAALVPNGYHPTFYIRTECGHNFNEAVYDLAHDHATIHPILSNDRAGGGVDSWLGSYPGSPVREEMYRGILMAPTAVERKERVMQMQRSIVEDVPVIFLAELPQVSAVTKGFERYVSDFSGRVAQALQYQNCNTGYLPS